MCFSELVGQIFSNPKKGVCHDQVLGTACARACLKLITVQHEVFSQLSFLPLHLFDDITTEILMTGNGEFPDEKKSSIMFLSSEETKEEPQGDEAKAKVVVLIMRFVFFPPPTGSLSIVGLSEKHIFN